MEKKRRFKENNGGYSLVELIIVIAIIVVLSAIGFVTITLIHSAKAKEAAITFEAELKECQAKAKSQTVVSKTGAAFHSDDSYALQLRVVGNKYYVRTIRYCPDPTGGGYMNNADLETRGKGNGADLSPYIYVLYQSDETGVAERKISSTEPAHIRFDKKGMCVRGSGTYKFCKASNNSVIATVTVNKNGSIQIK